MLLYCILFYVSETNIILSKFERFLNCIPQSFIVVQITMPRPLYTVDFNEIFRESFVQVYMTVQCTMIRIKL
jgi:hypothetical protein